MDNIKYLGPAILSVVGILITQFIATRQNKTSIKAEQYKQVLDNIFSKYHFDPAYYNVDKIMNFIIEIDSKEYSGFLNELRDSATDLLDKSNLGKIDTLDQDSISQLKVDYSNFCFLFERKNKQYKRELGFSSVVQLSSLFVFVSFAMLGMLFIFLHAYVFKIKIFDQFFHMFMFIVLIVGSTFYICGLLGIIWEILVKPSLEKMSKLKKYLLINNKKIKFCFGLV